MAALELQHVAKQYGRRSRPVLAGACLSAAGGEVIALGGSNGSGKSTLLRLAAGLATPTKGWVGRTGPVGYLPERFPANLSFTARAYLEHLARLDGRRVVAEVIEQFGLGAVDGLPMAELSKGMAQRVGVAQALLARPKVLLLDEPWSGLDGAGQAALATAIAETRGDGGAVIYTDHRGAATGVVPDRRVEVAGGVVTEVTVDRTPEARPHLTVIEVVGDRPPRLGDGILEVARHNGAWRIEVAGAEGDAVLRRLLDDGYSITLVER